MKQLGKGFTLETLCDNFDTEVVLRSTTRNLEL